MITAGTVSYKTNTGDSGWALAESIGIESVGGTVLQLLPAGSELPATGSFALTTAADHQSHLNVHVLAGESERAADNRTLGRFVVSGLWAASRGSVRVEIIVAVDPSGDVSVSAHDATLVEVELTVAPELNTPPASAAVVRV